jgi:anthranilate phosphoribosyltransferase
MMGIDDVGGWAGLLSRLAQGRDLTGDQARAAMTAMLQGKATDAQVAAYIVSLRIKGETVAELTGMLEAMLAVAERVELPADLSAIDVVGTGGDQAHSINVSTLSALVAAGAGAVVCKHGNRAQSSSAGTADVLDALGVRIDCGPEEVRRAVTEAGMGFCLAPRFHPAMRYVGPARKEMGIPTAFNILGPLANPAGVRRMLIGVADGSMAERMVGVLAARGCDHALVVHGDDGLDEITLTTTTSVVELRDGDVRQYRIDPAEFGLDPVPVDALRGGDPETNAKLARQVLEGEPGPHRDVVTLNAAAALQVAGVAQDLADGLARARRSIDDGAAGEVLAKLVAVSNSSR